MNAHIFELLSPSAISVYHFCSILSRMAADSAESAGIHYRQLCINLPPVADHIRPLFGQIMRGKIECFEQSSAVRKDTSATVQAAVRFQRAYPLPHRLEDGDALQYLLYRFL